MAKRDGESVTIRKVDDQPRVQMKAKRTLYVDADGEVTTDSAEAAQQITEKGVEILPHIIAQYDFQDGDLKVAKAKGDEKEVKGTAPTENKAASPAKATKGK